MTDLPRLTPVDIAILREGMRILASLDDREAGAAMVARIAILVAQWPREGEITRSPT